MKRHVWIGLVLLACGPKQPGTPDARELAPALETLAEPPQRSLLFHERMAVGELHVGEVEVVQAWSGPRWEDGAWVWQVQEVERGEQGEQVRATFELFYGAEGMGYRATAGIDGEAVHRWEPPELVLPAEPKVGHEWSQVHRSGDRVHERSCQIMAAELCEEGVVSVCDSETDDARMIVRHHFCAGQGWVGYESMLVREGVALRRWTEEVVRDGQSIDLEGPGEQQGEGRGKESP